MCLRDLLHLIKVLTLIEESDVLRKFSEGIFETMKQLQQQFEGQRFVLISIIEENEYPEAKKAFYQFVDQHGFDEVNEKEKQLKDPTQMVSVAMKMLRRAGKEKDEELVRICNELIGRSARQRKGLIPRIVLKTVANAMLGDSDERIKQKFTNWKKQGHQFDWETSNQISFLANTRYLGIGNDQFEEIKK
jgi:hypothetical protein